MNFWREYWGNRERALGVKNPVGEKSEPMKTKTIKVFVRKFVKRRRFLRFVLLGLALSLLVLILSGGRSLFAPQEPISTPLPYIFIPSPNCDDRPLSIVTNCVVLHATASETAESAVRHFLDPASKVSAHFIVGKSGEIIQMVPIEKRAWHAGASVWEGQERVNDFSVGIEIVNLNDGRDEYPEAQYLAVAGILRFLRSHYDILDSRIVSHAQVALPIGRKTDPVGFDFEKVKRLAAHP